MEQPLKKIKLDNFYFLTTVLNIKVSNYYTVVIVQQIDFEFCWRYPLALLPQTQKRSLGKKLAYKMSSIKTNVNFAPNMSVRSKFMHKE